ncbi:MAG TPA: hypothetical protein VGH14_20675 [Solirubrobacterales bacterium]
MVEKASTSQRTLYEHFKNKEDGIVVALDSGSAHMLAAALPAFRRAPDWKHAVRDTIEAMFAFGAEEPEYAHGRGRDVRGALYSLLYDHVNRKGPRDPPPDRPDPGLRHPGTVPRRQGRLRGLDRLMRRGV